MARSRTPQKSRNTPLDDDEGFSSTSIGSDDADDDEDEDEGEDDDEDESDEDEDRGDAHKPTPEDDDEDDEDESDEDEDEEGEDDESDEDDQDEDADEDALREIGGDARFVPRARLNEVLEENRLLRERERSTAPAAPAKDEPPAFDLKAKTKERNEKLLEGDIDAASEIDDEIATHHRHEAANTAANAARQVIEQEKVSEAIAEIQSKYPVLNDKKRAFDRDTLDEVVALRNVYIGRGERMDAALRKAAKRICERVPDRGEDEGRQRKPKQDANVMTLRQKREAMRRAKATPPALARQGASGRPAKGAGEMSESALTRMSDAKFRNLDHRDKAEARGDFLEPRKPKTQR